MTNLRVHVVASMLAVTACGVALAPPATKPEDLVQAEYIAAVKSGSTKALEALLHSKSEQCITQQTEWLFKEKWERTIRRGTPVPQKITATPFEGRIAAGTSQSQFPVAPTTQAKIAYGTAPNVLTTILLLAPEGDPWRIVESCPGEGGTAHIR